MTQRRVILGSVPRMTKLGACSAQHAPSRMVKDLAEHEGLHERRQDCFSWAWNASASAIAYEAQLLARLEAKRQLHGDVIDVEEVTEPIALPAGDKVVDRNDPS